MEGRDAKGLFLCPFVHLIGQFTVHLAWSHPRQSLPSIPIQPLHPNWPFNYLPQPKIPVSEFPAIPALQIIFAMVAHCVWVEFVFVDLDSGHSMDFAKLPKLDWAIHVSSMSPLPSPSIHSQFIFSFRSNAMPMDSASMGSVLLKEICQIEIFKLFLYEFIHYFSPVNSP